MSVQETTYHKQSKKSVLNTNSSLICAQYYAQQLL